MNSENKTKIRVNDLDLYYGEKQALKGINMDIRENEVTALIGPSGCGKSTFLRCLNRMNDLIDCVKINGKIYMDDEEILTTNDVISLRTRVGMVFQKANLFPMSIYDNVAYGPRNQGIKDKKILDKIVEESLKGAAIWDEVKDRLKSPALGLSGGQQQRVAIARSLVSEAPVILADEPTGNLDPKTAGDIVELLKSLAQKTGKCVIVVTHSKEVAQASDITLELKDKKLTEI